MAPKVKANAVIKAVAQKSQGLSTYNLKEKEVITNGS
jgi:hypothetical protein